jgi:hypothetical protein
MFAADTQLEVRIDFSRMIDSGSNKYSNTGFVERLEGVKW